jgi:hypothetical protein
MYDQHSAKCHQLDFLRCRTAEPFFRDLYIGHAYFAIRAIRLAAGLHPTASLALLQKECKRVHTATAHSSKASIDHCISVVNSMLQHSDDLFEPDSSAHIAIQLQWPTAATTAHHQGGHLFNGEVRRQLALYHRELVNTSGNRKNTIAVKGKLDPGGLQQKQAGGRLPADLSLITRMRAQLWEQVWTPVWTKVQDWLRSRGLEASEQSYLSTAHLDTLGSYLRMHGLTDIDITNMRTLMCLELCFQRSQVWLGALCREFSIVEHDGMLLYKFQLSRSFKRASSTSRGSLPASVMWPLSKPQSVLVHTLLHVDKPKERFFNMSGSSIGRLIKRLGWNWCGIPRLGPHVLRTGFICEAVNRADVTPSDYPALGAHVQSSVDTVLNVYAALSLHGTPAQVAFKLHNPNPKQPEPPGKKQKVEAEPAKENVSSNQLMLAQFQQMMQQQRSQHQKKLTAMQSLNEKASDNAMPDTQAVIVPVTADAPKGRALNTLRLQYMTNMKSYFMTLEHAVCTEEQAPATELVKRVFHQLCQHRSAHKLGTGAAWFESDVTYFTDDNELPFANFIRKYWSK